MDINNYELQLLIQLINFITVLMNVMAGLIIVYCLFSIPAQIIRRFRLKKRGQAVSPILLIIRKLLKYWFLTALVLIPCSIIISSLNWSIQGLSGSEIFVALLTTVLAGNIMTTLLIGYFFMKRNKGSWSHSVKEEEAKRT